MKQKRTRVVEFQKVEELNGPTSSENNYERFVETKGRGSESPLANPDSLADSTENKFWGDKSSPELAELIIERFADTDGNFKILSPKENEVLKLYTATGDIAVVCNNLRLSRSSVREYLVRIQSKFQRLLKAVDLP